MVSQDRWEEQARSPRRVDGEEKWNEGERQDAEPVGLRPVDGTRVAVWNLQQDQAGELRCYRLLLTLSAVRHCRRHWRDGKLAETGCVASSQLL